MKIGLILSNDWELFGDGSGDYFDIQHRPLEEMLCVAEDHGARLTVMAEVGQQWAHQQLSADHAWAGKIAESWESILKDVVRQGSDVQLHYHPQWSRHKYIAGRWQLDVDKWALTSLSPDEIRGVFRKGKYYLDQLLKPVRDDYECIAFRAGAYCIQPSKVVIRELLDAGMICDTSVTHGFHNPPFYDFRNANSNCFPWITGEDDVCVADEQLQGVLEIPVCSATTIDSAVVRRAMGERHFGRYFLGVNASKNDFEWLKDREKILQLRYPIKNRPSAIRNRVTDSLRGSMVDSVRWAAGKVMGRRDVQLDYDNLSPSMFVKCIEKAVESVENSGLKGEDALIVPVMASGHVKTMHNCENFRRILSAVEEVFGDRLIYWTLREAARYWNGRLRSSAVPHLTPTSTVPDDNPDH